MPPRLPAQGTTGVPLLDTLVGLGAGVSGLSAGTLLVYASAATGAYAVWEQMRFRMARYAEEGAAVTGGRGSLCFGTVGTTAAVAGLPHFQRGLQGIQKPVT